MPPLRHFSLPETDTFLNGQSASLSPSRRLDRVWFWLRWLWLASAMLIVLTAGEEVFGTSSGSADRLPFVVVVAISGNLLFGFLALVVIFPDHWTAIAGILLDTVLALLFFWAFDASLSLLILLGLLALAGAGFRLNWQGILLAWPLLAIGTFVIAQSEKYDLAHTGLILVALLAFGILGVALRSFSALATGKLSKEDPREVEAARLRATRERASALYEMANTLSATLDWRRILEAAQDIGLLGLRELGAESKLVSVVLLFQGKDNKLRVVTSRRLTRADQQVAVTGRRGVLGLALKQAEPVFAGDAARDPELRYFVAFQETKSVLAIPLRAGFENYGVLVFGSDQPLAFTDEHVELMSAIGTQATIQLQNAVLYQNLVNEKERIVDVEEDARKKLARDLHDGPTQSVAAIAMRVNYIRRLLERQPQQATEELWKVEELARRTTKELRHMLFTLRPLVLESQGLLAALAQLVEKMKDTHNLDVILKGQPGVEEYLDTHAQGVLFYIVEEAVNNARKHAQAEHIWTRIYRREGYVVVEIEDDGVGFDVGAVNTNYESRGSLGMVNMRERAELVEGTLRIQSAKGRGTKITILVPIQPASGPGAGTGESAAKRDVPPPLHLQSQKSNGDGSSSTPTPPPTE